jgi:hypothetical protein
MPFGNYFLIESIAGGLAEMRKKHASSCQIEEAEETFQRTGIRGSVRRYPSRQPIYETILAACTHRRDIGAGSL